MENIMDRVLEEHGLNYEDLNPAERETYNKSNFQIKTINIGDIKNNISYMKNSIALQLCDTDGKDVNDKLLKARLKNYILLQSFLLAPEKAQEALNKRLDKK